MHICIYIYICIHAYTYICIYAYTCMYTCRYGHSKLALLLFTKELDSRISSFPPLPPSDTVTVGMAARNATKKVTIECVLLL